MESIRTRIDRIETGFRIARYVIGVFLTVFAVFLALGIERCSSFNDDVVRQTGAIQELRVRTNEDRGALSAAQGQISDIGGDLKGIRESIKGIERSLKKLEAQQEEPRRWRRRSR